jgi:hypothetical protein
MNPTPRRTMSAALRSVDLPPEAISLIREGSPKSLAVAPSPSVRPEEPPKSVALPGLERGQGDANPTPGPGTEAESAPGITKAKTKVVQLKEPAGTERESLVPMSIRIPVALLEALLRAASERKIKRVRPYTQQEIVADALSTWLKRGGYL